MTDQWSQPAYTHPPQWTPHRPPRKRPAYRRAWFWLLIAGVAIIAAVGAAVGSAGHTGSVNTKAATGSITHPAGPSAAHVGSTIDIAGQSSGNTMAVTLVKVTATTRSTDDIDTPEPGTRYYAAQYRLTNDGQQPYDDDPWNSAKVLDSAGQQYDTTIIGGGVAAGPLMPTLVKLAPGGAVLGWIVFEVPTHSVITGTQFALSSGFGNAGQWKIP